MKKSCFTKCLWLKTLSMAFVWNLMMIKHYYLNESLKLMCASVLLGTFSKNDFFLFSLWWSEIVQHQLKTFHWVKKVEMILNNWLQTKWLFLIFFYHSCPLKLRLSSCKSEQELLLITLNNNIFCFNLK